MSNASKKTAKNATDALIILWEEGFFKTNQNFRNVCENLTN